MNADHRPDAAIATTQDEVERTVLRLGFGLDGVDVAELHAMALSLQGLGARVRVALDAGVDALSTSASGEP